MANLYPSLSVGVVPELGEQPAVDGGLKSWILTGSYLPTSTADSSIIELQISDFSRLVRHLSFDFERFTLSCRETYFVALSEKERHNLTGWPLLKLYYAAFFAAHAIMRSQGCGYVKLDKEHVNYLNSITSMLYPDSALLVPGMFRYSIVQPAHSGSLSLKLHKDKKDGGVHEGFWKVFCEFLLVAADSAVDQKAANANDFFVGASEISEAIRGDTSIAGMWFSSVRNEINYQHQHDAWFPSKKTSKAFISLINNDPAASCDFNFQNSVKIDTLPQFTFVSRYLVRLNFEISEYVAVRSSKGKSFGQKWRRFSSVLG